MVTFLKLALLALSIVVIIWLARRAVRNARRLDERIEQHHKEQEEQGPRDPYQALSELFRQEDKETRDK